MSGLPLLSSYPPSITKVFLQALVIWMVTLVGVRAQGVDTMLVVLVDPEGNPLPNALIHSRDYKFQASTDIDGRAEIPNFLSWDTLCFTYYGYDMISLACRDLDEIGPRITMSPLSEDLEEVLVIGRTDSDKRSMPYQVDQIKAKELSFAQSQTTADALDKLADVFVQKSQMGGGSPVIRGFEASRVLLVVDGVRMNNLIYRSGHLQNAITVDGASLEQLEIIYGPGSLMYGSDALGGVVHFRTKDPMLSFGQGLRTDLHLSTRYASANDEKTVHVDLNLGGKKIAYWGSVSYSDFGDLRAGKQFSSKYPRFGSRPYYVDTEGPTDQVVPNDEPALQVGTAYDQLDMVHKIKWTPSRHYTQTLTAHYSESSDIPRYDQLSETGEGPQDFTFAEWYYGPQDRLLIASKSDIRQSNSLYDRALLIASYQSIGEDRINRRFQSNRRLYQQERVDIFAITADFDKQISSSERWTLNYGLEWNYNTLDSEAFHESRDGSRRRFDALTRYPDDRATMSTLGGYVSLRTQWDERWSTNAGIRYSDITTKLRYARAQVDWPVEYVAGISNANTAVTWGLNLTYEDPSGWHVHTQVGSAFRSPNVDDLAKIRLKGGQVSVPNPDLKPERSNHAELTVGYDLANDSGLQSISITGFYTHLDDAIVQAPFVLPNGEHTFFYEGETFRPVANLNAEEADLFGISAQVELAITEHFGLKSAVNYTTGETTADNGEVSPMAHIPPIYGHITVSFKREAWRAETVVRFNGAKPLSKYSNNSADNPEFATPEGSLAWTTVNLYLSYQVSPVFKIQTALENLLDKHYRPFSSGLSAPGRNLAVTLSATI